MKIEVEGIVNGWADPVEKFVVISLGDKKETHAMIFFPEKGIKDLIRALQVYADSIM